MPDNRGFTVPILYFNVSIIHVISLRCVFLYVVIYLAEVPECVLCGERSSNNCSQCISEFTSCQDVVNFCDVCSSRVHRKRGHYVSAAVSRVYLELLSVICIETSHYVCFTRDSKVYTPKWIFFDSMASSKCELCLFRQLLTWPK